MVNSIIHINKSKVRTIAFLVLVSGVIFLISPNFFIPILLVLDFGLRAFDFGKYSPFALLSDIIIKIFNFTSKTIFYPPKRFAARIGLIFSLTILGLHISNTNPLIVVSTLVLFAALESLAGICAGCYVYNWLSPFFEKLKK